MTDSVGVRYSAGSGKKTSGRTKSFCLLTALDWGSPNKAMLLALIEPNTGFMGNDSGSYLNKPTPPIAPQEDPPKKTEHALRISKRKAWPLRTPVFFPSALAAAMLSV